MHKPLESIKTSQHLRILRLRWWTLFRLRCYRYRASPSNAGTISCPYFSTERTTWTSNPCPPPVLTSIQNISRHTSNKSILNPMANALLWTEAWYSSKPVKSTSENRGLMANIPSTSCCTKDVWVLLSWGRRRSTLHIYSITIQLFNHTFIIFPTATTITIRTYFQFFIIAVYCRVQLLLI